MRAAVQTAAVHGSTARPRSERWAAWATVLLACAAVAGGCRSEPRPRWRKERLTRLVRLSDFVRPGVFAVSADGLHLAYGEALPQGDRIVADGKLGPILPGCDQPTYSPVTNRLFYWTRSEQRGPERIGIMADGVQLPARFAQPGTFVFSRDGKRWAAIGGRAQQGPVVLFVDGREVGSYKDASLPVFSDDGAHLAWLVQRDDDRIALMVDEKERRVFPAPQGRVSPAVKANPVGPNLSPQFDVRYLTDGSLVVVAQDADGWAVYRDGARLGSYRHNVWMGGALAVKFGDEFRAETSFTPLLMGTAETAPVAAWWERADGEFDRWRVVRNGMPVDDEICDQYWRAQPVVLSHDGKHAAYFCLKLGPGTMGEGDVVVDGRHYGPFQRAFGVALSDDGAHLAYGGWNGERTRGWTFYRDGKPMAGPFDSVWRPRFDPTGTHVAFEAHQDKANLLAVDHRMLAHFEDVFWGPEFPIPGYVSWVIRHGESQSIRRLSVRLD